MDLDSNSNPLERINLLESKVSVLTQVVFGDDRTRTESLFAKMDRLQLSVDAINRRQTWLMAGLLFVVGLTCMIILQMVYEGFQG